MQFLPVFFIHANHGINSNVCDLQSFSAQFLIVCATGLGALTKLKFQVAENQKSLVSVDAGTEGLAIMQIPLNLGIY